jgi:hypothetical protein
MENLDARSMKVTRRWPGVKGRRVNAALASAGQARGGLSGTGRLGESMLTRVQPGSGSGAAEARRAAPPPPVARPWTQNAQTVQPWWLLALSEVVAAALSIPLTLGAPWSAAGCPAWSAWPPVA